MADAWDFEVAVIGGGPGGSSAAASLARSARRVVVLERATFPRFHIGESQLPFIHEALTAIGAGDAVAGAGFVNKWGASFCGSDGEPDRYADFSRAVEVPRPQTYQVPRDRFDQVLLGHARTCGADVRQGWSVDDVTFDADGVTLSCSDTGSAPQRIRAGAVVDASGRTGIVAKRFGTRVADPQLDNIALHRQFQGVPRGEGRRAGDIRIITTDDGGWFWFIPISDTVMSVGVVMPQTVYRSIAAPTPVETLENTIMRTPAARRLLEHATPLTAARFDADYSYLHSCQAGDRFVLVGDAGAFLDPIFSTGVLLAMQSGVEAAGAIDAGLSAGDLSARRFAAFERQVVRRYHYFRRFAVGFYEPAFRDLFLNPSSRCGLFEAVLSVLAGNWRPSLATRLRLAVFFFLVAVQRAVPLAPRHLRPRVVHDVR